MASYAYVFPGQGSQSVGMMTAWGEQQARVDSIFAEASEVLGYDLRQLVAEGPEARLNQTEVTQPAMLCAGVACYRIAAAEGGMPAATMMAGHSLGEYTALVCAGALDLADAVRLVAKRGRLMQSAVAEGKGLVAAIIGLADDAVVEACRRVETGVVEAANFNAPGQVVISGERAAVEAAMQEASTLGAKRTLPLAVSVPVHCSLMREAAEALADELESVELGLPEVPVVHNQSAEVADSVESILERLKLQLYQPVRWVASVETMKRHGIGGLIECGPGKVLAGLARRIDKQLEAYAIFDANSLEQVRTSLAGD